VVMDPSPPEQAAVRTFVAVLPDPFPMLSATDQIEATNGRAMAFRHADRGGNANGQVWIVWALAGSGGAVVRLPVVQDRVDVVTVAGHWETVRAKDGHVQIELLGDAKMPPPVLVVDRPAESAARNRGR
jgi:hypothetical protein